MSFELNMNIYTQPKTNISFQSQYKPLVRKINPEVIKRAEYLIPFVNEANNTLHSLEQASNSPVVKKLFDFIKKELKLFRFNEDENSLTFDNGKTNLIIKTPDIDSITLEEQDKESGAIKYSIETHKRKIISQSETLKRVDLAENFLQQFLDSVDFSLLKFRRIVSKPENIYIIKDLKEIIEKQPSEQTTTENQKTLPKSVLPNSILKEMEEISKYYKQIFEDLSSITNPSTRSRWKNDYYNITASPRGSRAIGFQKEGYKLLVNYANDHLQEYLILQKITNNEDVTNFILGMNGKAYKQKALACLKEQAKSVEFYTQEEIDSPEFKNILLETKHELAKYSEYIQGRMKMKDERFERLSTSEIGNIDENTLKLVQEVKFTYEKCKESLASIHDKEKKSLAKDYFGISSRAGSPSFILRNITDEHEDLQISFPIVDNKTCTKILLLEGVDSIKNSFFIMDNKLVKFEAKKLGRSARIDNKLNYYSQNEIESFGLDSHLNKILARLNTIINGITHKEYLK